MRLHCDLCFRNFALRVSAGAHTRRNFRSVKRFFRSRRCVFALFFFLRRRDAAIVEGFSLVVSSSSPI